VAGKLCGTSPMRLIENCVKCGADATRGRRFDTMRYFYPVWIWLGLFVGVIPVIALFYAVRKPLEISFSLCPACEQTRRRNMWTALGAWVLTTATILVAVWLADAWILIGTAVFFLAGVVTSIRANTPLAAIGHKKQVFTVKGFDKGFMACRGTGTGRTGV
jgi:hypothetical protein